MGPRIDDMLDKWLTVADAYGNNLVGYQDCMRSRQANIIVVEKEKKRPVATKIA